MPSTPELVPLSSVATIELDRAGSVTSIQPTSFLERWGTIFVAGGLVWMLLVATGLLVYYLTHLPPEPVVTGLNPNDIRSSLETHKEIYDQYRQSLTDIFDLIVTRTVLPIITLLLGYLFGKTPSRSM